MRFVVLDTEEAARAGIEKINRELLPQPLRGVNENGVPVGPVAYFPGAYGWTVSIASVYQARDGRWVIIFLDAASERAAALIASGDDRYTSAELTAVANAASCDDMPEECWPPPQGDSP